MLAIITNIISLAVEAAFEIPDFIMDATDRDVQDVTIEFGILGFACGTYDDSRDAHGFLIGEGWIPDPEGGVEFHLNHDMPIIIRTATSKEWRG